MDPSKKEYDIYRDSPLRYLGYTNEIGESFRPVVKKWFVHSSYAVAIAYVLADAGDKTIKAYKKPEIIGGGTKAAVKTAFDVFIWQMMASVVIPGFTINRLCWASGKLIRKAQIKGFPRKWGATLIGLASIPLIIHPIDRCVDYAMDNTYRKYV